MDSLNQSLIEKLEKARMHVSEMMPEDHRMAMSNFNSGLKEAIAIIRQHEASIEPSKSATSDHVNDKDVVEIGSEIPDDINKLCESQNAYLRTMEPVSIELAAEAAHNNYWADEYKNASGVEKAAARQQAKAIAKVWGLAYAD